MRSAFIILTLWLFSINSKAQDPLLRSLIGDEINCPEIAGTASDRIAGLEFEEEEEIYYILNYWQDSCGFSEPHFRLQTLYLIAYGTLSDSALPDDYLDFIYNYLYRLDDAQREDYSYRYEYNAEYYSYVPLRNAFDDWTRNVAKELLKGGNHTPLQNYFLTLYSAATRREFERNLFGNQYDTLPVALEMRKIRRDRKEENGRVTLHSGMWQALGPLSNYWDPTLMLGLDFSGRISDQLRGELGFQFRIPQNKASFRVNAEDSAQTTKSRFAGTVYFGLSRKLLRGRNYYFGLFGSLGLDFTTTDIEILHNDPEQGNTTSYFTLFSYNLSLGPEWVWITPNLNEIGVRTLYMMMDYNSGTKSISNMKGHSFSLALFYRF